MFKADYFFPKGRAWHHSAHKGKGGSTGAAWLKGREGYDIILYPLSYWVLGGELGERLRGDPGGDEAMWECRDLFIEVNSRCWSKMKGFVGAVSWYF